MRCIIGVVLFVILYFGSLAIGRQIVVVRAANNGATAKTADRAGGRFVADYHAYLMAGSGLIALAGCALPTLLAPKGITSEAELYEREFRKYQAAGRR